MAHFKLDDLYGDAILDHCRHPRNVQMIANPTVSGSAVNPFCGDEVSTQLLIEDNLVSIVGMQSQGCSINRASASMLSEEITGKYLNQIIFLNRNYREFLSSPMPAISQLNELGELRSLTCVREFPIRIKCALLPFSALENALGKHA